LAKHHSGYKTEQWSGDEALGLPAVGKDGIEKFLLEFDPLDN